LHSIVRLQEPARLSRRGRACPCPASDAKPGRDKPCPYGCTPNIPLLALSKQIQDSAFDSLPCDLCSAIAPEFVLASRRLDGPLVRCRACLLYYVTRNCAPAEAAAQGDAAAEMSRLAGRARELELVEPHVEESERPWRELAARERVADLSRFVGAGRLLEVGCSTGELLIAAGERFAATGIEADRASSLVALGRGLDCVSGTLADAEFTPDRFDVAVLYHTIEHLPSPRSTLLELRRVVRPGGWLVLETPNIATLWYRVLGPRWRQFIPDHRFFFTPQTIRRLCDETGFEIRELRSAGKAMSVRLFLSRIGRYHRPLGKALARFSQILAIEDSTLRLNLGDVMRVYAVKR